MKKQLFLLSFCVLALALCFASRAYAEVHYTIQGRVTTADGKPLRGVTILGSGCAFSVQHSVTDAAGLYRFDVRYCGSSCDRICGTALTYRLTPYLTGYSFSPSAVPASGVDLPLTGDVTQDFEAAPIPNIIGNVTDENLRPLPDVTVSLTGCSKNLSVKTDQDGDYAFSLLPTCSAYALAAGKAGYAFSPIKPTVSVTSAAGSKPAVQDFDGARLKLRISGSLGVADCDLDIEGDGNCVVSGLEYRCTDIPYGSSVLLTPVRTSYTFSPNSKAFFEITADQTFNFTPTYQAPPACGDGRDNDNDGDVDFPEDRDCSSDDDSDESIDVRSRGCTTIDIKNEKGTARLGPGELEAYALRALKTLRKNAARTNSALSARLKQSATNASTVLNRLVIEAQVALQSLPDAILSCPDTSSCVSVDNSAMIGKHLAAVHKLRAAVLRTLNRATRLTSPSIQAARKLTTSTGRRVRALEKKLEQAATKLPKQMSVCHS